MKYRYVPILRTKDGEAIALTELSATSKNRLLPAIQITTKPAAKFASSLAKGWAGLPIALDGLYNFAVTGSPAAYVAMFNQLGLASLKIIPSVLCNSDPAYVSVVKPLVNSFSSG